MDEYVDKRVSRNWPGTILLSLVAFLSFAVVVKALRVYTNDKSLLIVVPVHVAQIVLVALALSKRGKKNFFPPSLHYSPFVLGALLDVVYSRELVSLKSWLDYAALLMLVTCQATCYVALVSPDTIPLLQPFTKLTRKRGLLIKLCSI